MKYIKKKATPLSRIPMAQLLSSGLLCMRSLVRTLGGAPLRVLKLLRRKCCLCTYICKWLDFQVG